MKKILVYGDSNVWGDNFLTGKRIPYDKQWVNILKNKLKDKYMFFQEGLPGRIAGGEETLKKYKNGKDTFVSTYRSNAPIDILIIALGTNDLQIKYNKSSDTIINDLLWYKETLEKSFNDMDYQKKYFNNKKPKIIYILPINFDYKNKASIIFDSSSERKRQEIISYFENHNLKNIYSNNMELLDDGIHLNFEGHEHMANLVMEVINHD